MKFYQKRSTFIYVILILYVCTFFFFVAGLYFVENLDFKVNNYIKAEALRYLFKIKRICIFIF